MQQHQQHNVGRQLLLQASDGQDCRVIAGSGVLLLLLLLLLLLQVQPQWLVAATAAAESAAAPTAHSQLLHCRTLPSHEAPHLKACAVLQHMGPVLCTVLHPCCLGVFYGCLQLCLGCPDSLHGCCHH
jgi:hypothetical protein